MSHWSWQTFGRPADCGRWVGMSEPTTLVIVATTVTTGVAGERPLISAKGLISVWRRPRSASNETMPSKGLVGLGARACLERMLARDIPAVVRRTMENFMLKNRR